MTHQKLKLWHVFTYGRFGPEKHMGFLRSGMEGPSCIKQVTYLGISVVKSTDIDPAFFTNPLALNGMDYRKWRRRQRRRDDAKR